MIQVGNYSYLWLICCRGNPNVWVRNPTLPVAYNLSSLIPHHLSNVNDNDNDNDNETSDIVDIHDMIFHHQALSYIHCHTNPNNRHHHVTTTTTTTTMCW